MKKTSLIAWLLLAVMIVSSLAGCNTHKEITPNDTTEDTTEAASETHPETETGTETETESESEPETESETGNSNGLDTTPLSIKPREDLFPEHSEYETSASSEMPKIDIRVEAEDFVSSTIPWTKLVGKEFSNGVLMRCLGGAVNGWDVEYTTTY